MGVPNSVIEGVPNFVIEGVPNTEEIKKKLKKIQDFFSGQGVPRNTLSCKWRRHCLSLPHEMYLNWYT